MTAALVPPAVAKWQFVEEHARGVLDAHCHREVRPPLSGDDADAADDADAKDETDEVGLGPLAAAYAATLAAGGDRVARWYALGPVLHAGRERRRIAVVLFGAAAATADLELRALAHTLLEQCGIEARRLTLTRQGDQFTFTLAEAAAPVLCQGGRQDQLVTRAGGPPTPAVGFVVDLDALVAALRDADEGYQPAVNVLVVPRAAASAEAALAVAQRLRASGIRTDFAHDGASPSDHLDRAAAAGVRLVALVGGELMIELIDVETGDGESITPDDLDVRVAQLLD